MISQNQKSPSVPQSVFHSRQSAVPMPSPHAAAIDELAYDQAPFEIDARAEDVYWAEHFRDSPYVPLGTPYTQVRAAYRFGWESRRRMPHASWAIALPRLRSEWGADPANFLMSWNEAEHAVRDAWNHAGARRH